MAKTSQTTSLPGLPSLSELLTNTWLRLKEIGGRIVGLYLLMMVVTLVTFFIGMAIGGMAAFGGVALSNFNVTSVLGNPTTWITLGSLFLVTVLVVGFIANAFTAAIILAVDQGESKQPLSQLLRRGFELIVPLFLVGLVVQLLTFGGLFLAIIPGIIIAVFLSFSMYEVILGNARGLTALKNSVSIVQQNFWGVLGRWAALIGIQLIVTLVLGSLSEGQHALAPIFSLLSSVASIFFSLFMLVYGVLLYRAARANTDLQKGSLTWIWIVSALGWVVGVFVLIVAASGIGQLIQYLQTKDAADIQSEWQIPGYDSTLPSDEMYFDGTSFEGSEEAATTGTSPENEQYEQFLRDITETTEFSQENLDRLYQDATQFEQQPVQ